MEKRGWLVAARVRVRGEEGRRDVEERDKRRQGFLQFFTFWFTFLEEKKYIFLSILF